MVTTITTTGAEDARIAAAFGDLLKLGRNATAAEVKSTIATFVNGVVQNYETQVYRAAMTYTAVSPT